MTDDMTVKEYAYLLLFRKLRIRESELRGKLHELYQDSCVDCILREIREEDPRVRCLPIINEDDVMLVYMAPPHH